VTLATRDDLSALNGPGVDSVLNGSVTIPIDTGSQNDFPDSTLPPDVQQLPQALQLEQPAFPEIARRSGMTGVVWIKALIDKEGNVVRATVAKSSTYPVLDDAALAVAFKGRFSPAIQNGYPVPCWVTYKVAFMLNEAR
jgi:TonB family protein